MTARYVITGCSCPMKNRVYGCTGVYTVPINPHVKKCYIYKRFIANGVLPVHPSTPERYLLPNNLNINYFSLYADRR